MNTARQEMSSAGVDSTAGVIFGGDGAPGKTAKTETWNGTNWAEVADLSTARAYMNGGAGTSTAGLAFGGETATARTAATEEWSGSTTVTKTVSTD
jgi:hypothetical protein